jgi:hypothetical protein
MIGLRDYQSKAIETISDGPAALGLVAASCE